MQGINEWIGIGRMTNDPILRVTTTNKSVCSFTIAIDRPRGKDQQESGTDFIDCIVWGNSADNTKKYTHKGSLVGVKGRLQKRKYQDKNGNNRYVTEVVCSLVQFLDSKEKSEQYEEQNYEEQSYEEQTYEAGDDSFIITTDDLPF